MCNHLLAHVKYRFLIIIIPQIKHDWSSNGKNHGTNTDNLNVNSVHVQPF